MTNFALKNLVAATALIATGLANAAPMTLAGDSLNMFLSRHLEMFTQGSATLSFSPYLLGALDLAKVTVAPYGTNPPVTIMSLDGYYVDVSLSAPITSLTIESTTNAALSTTTTGGATLTAPAGAYASTGGSITVTDLNVDFLNKKVYATIIGANGVNTLTNFYLWDIATITGETTVTPRSGSFQTQVSGLSITSAGRNTFVQALGLVSLGMQALAGVTDFGTINVVITSQPIPEPSTYALMALGLVGMGLVARRRAK